MNNDPQARPVNDKAEANIIFTIQGDNEPRPLDKIEGHMNNGETGGATEADREDEQPEDNQKAS